MAKKDLNSRADVVRLVDSFYNRVKADPLLSPVFSHLNWEIHMPVMYNFWSSLLFGDMTYQGSPFQKHRHLKITTSHFSKWLELFHQSVDELFEGDKACEAKDRARSIAGIFQHKMGLFNDVTHRQHRRS